MANKKSVVCEEQIDGNRMFGGDQVPPLVHRYGFCSGVINAVNGELEKTNEILGKFEIGEMRQRLEVFPVFEFVSEDSRDPKRFVKLNC